MAKAKLTHRDKAPQQRDQPGIKMYAITEGHLIQDATFTYCHERRSQPWQWSHDKSDITCEKCVTEYDRKGKA